MLEERRPLVSSRTEPAPVPNVQVHLLERRGSARELRRAPLRTPFPPAFQNRRSWVAKVSPQKPSEPSKGSAPRAR